MTTAETLRRRLQRTRQAFEARPSRERVLITLAIAALALVATDAQWLTPAFKQWTAGRSTLRGAQTQLASLQQQFDRAQAQGLADDLRLRQQLAGARQQLRDGDEVLRRHEASLIGPERMLALLEQLLARHGELRVRSLQSLPKVDVLAEGGGAQTGAPALYRHGVELVLEGRYADLLDYLRALEALPQRLRWGDLQFRVEQHPRCVLTLRVYTLSLDRRWLEI